MLCERVISSLFCIILCVQSENHMHDGSLRLSAMMGCRRSSIIFKQKIVYLTLRLGEITGRAFTW